MDPLATHPSLLLRIRDSTDAGAWSEFFDLYMPLLHSYGLRQGLQDSDAADISQETMRQIVRAIGRFEYDRSHGSFRGWLLSIARNEIRKVGRKRPVTAKGTGDTGFQSVLADLPAPESDEEFEREYQIRAFHWAAEKVRGEFRETTWRAFWASAVEHQTPQTVATKLGLSVGAVYIARTRVLACIRREISLAEQVD